MTEQVQAPSDESEDLSIGETVNDLAMLKHKADLLGVPYSNNIGADTLRERIRAKQEALESGSSESAQEAPPAVNPLTGQSTAPGKKMSLRQMLHRDQMKLVRLRITNMDPKKKDLPGEILTVANEYLGTVRKFVPYGEQTENGFHVPYCLYKMMDARRFLNIRTRKGPNKQIIVEQNWAREFALEVLPDLTEVELKRLAVAQAASSGTLDVE